MTITYQSAFDFMNEMYEYDFTDDQSDVVAQAKIELELLCMKAINKQIPQKVELWESLNYHAKNYPCPNCKEMLGLNVSKKYTKYCPNCGQALNWGE